MKAGKVLGGKQRYLAAVLTVVILTQLLVPGAVVGALNGDPVGADVLPLTEATLLAPPVEGAPVDNFGADSTAGGAATGQSPEEAPLELIPAPANPTSVTIDGRAVAAKAGELIVHYRSTDDTPMSALSLQAASDAGNATVYPVPSGVDLESALAELQADPDVLYVEPNYLIWAASVDNPSDARFGEQWALPALAAPAAWREHEQEIKGADPVTVAVLDTGVDTAHEDLVGQLLPGRSFAQYRDDDTPYSDLTDYSDDNGHGTQVTGIIAAKHDNGVGISGVVGPGSVQVLPIKVLNDGAWGTVFDLANGIRYAADQGARVINLSLTVEESSQTLLSAIRYAQDQGALVVAAVGSRWERIYPGAYSGVLTVGAIDSALSQTMGSASLDHIDLAAPGASILTTGVNSSYVQITGSSAAAAHISGAAALYLLLHPEATASDAASALVAAADDLLEPGWDDDTGHGLPQLDDLLGATQSDQPVISWLLPAPAAPLLGEVELQVEVVNAASVASVAFYLDSVTPAALLGVVERASGQSLASLTWDTIHRWGRAHALRGLL